MQMQRAAGVSILLLNTVNWIYVKAGQFTMDDMNKALTEKVNRASYHFDNSLH